MRTVVGMILMAGLAACSSGGGGGSGGGAGPGGAANAPAPGTQTSQQQAPAPILFSLPAEQEIALSVRGTRLRTADGTGPDAETGAVLQLFTPEKLVRKAQSEDFAVFRYASAPNSLADNLRILALSPATIDGQAVLRGQGQDRDVRPGRVDARDFQVDEVRQTFSIYGLVEVDERRPQYGDFQNLHAYAGGITPAAGGLPTVAVQYNGGFVGFLVENAGANLGDATRVGGSLVMDVDFTRTFLAMTGRITLDGTVANSIDLSGTINGTGFDGLAVVNADAADRLTSGAIGPIDGQFNGLLAEELTGALDIDSNDVLLIGAFGGAR